MPPKPTAVLQGPTEVTVDRVAVYDGSRSRSPGGLRSWRLWVDAEGVIEGTGPPPSVIPLQFATLGSRAVRLEVVNRANVHASSTLVVTVLAEVDLPPVLGVTASDPLAVRESLSASSGTRTLQVRVSDAIQFPLRPVTSRPVHVSDLIVLP